MYNHSCEDLQVWLCKNIYSGPSADVTQMSIVDIEITSQDKVTKTFTPQWTYSKCQRC